MGGSYRALSFPAPSVRILSRLSRVLSSTGDTGASAFLSTFLTFLFRRRVVSVISPSLTAFLSNITIDAFCFSVRSVKRLFSFTTYQYRRREPNTKANTKATIITLIFDRVKLPFFPFGSDTAAVVQNSKGRNHGRN